MTSGNPLDAIQAAGKGKGAAGGSVDDGLPGNRELSQLVDFLELVLDNLYSGVIVCDCNCRIVFMNKVYGELLKIDPRLTIGRHVEDFFTSSRLPQVVASGEAELGQRCALKSATPLLVNRIPIRRAGEVIGVILQTVFRDFRQFTDLLGRLNLLENEVRYYKTGLNNLLSAVYRFDDILTRSPRLERIKQDCRKYAQRDAPILLQGPTGSGKELFAHAIHRASPRAEGPFVPVNCAALPRDLLEAELFGYEAGAFTGANAKGKMGKIALANAGTLFLDEIGELPLGSQSKLLRVLESKSLDRLGSVNSIQVDFRLVAATNRDLGAMMARGAFREDLYFRLNTLGVRIPSLAERIEDIPTLIGSHLVDIRHGQLEFSDDALGALQAYHWPGNIRELKNVVERAVSLVDGNRVRLEHLPPELVQAVRKPMPPPDDAGLDLSVQLARCEKEIVARTISAADGNMARAARMLKISRSTLYAKCHRYRLAAADADPAGPSCDGDAARG